MVWAQIGSPASDATGPLRHLVATSQPLTSLSALRTFALLVVPGRVDRELIDWRVRAPRPMRVLVKKILRKYGYPPDLQDAAVQVVLQQAEALSAECAGTVEAGS